MVELAKMASAGFVEWTVFWTVVVIAFAADIAKIQGINL